MTSRVVTTAEPAEWEAALPASRSVFGSAAFARVAEAHDPGADAVLLVAEADGSRCVYPTLMRGVGDLEFVGDVGGADIASPPFTGPLLEGDAAAVAPKLERLLADEGVIAEFAHLNPWSAAPELAGGGEPDREIVWVDVTLDPEALWRDSYSKACRKNVKRSEREGVTVRPAESEDDIAEFHRIYISTMDRNDAQDHYFYGEDYFQQIFREMPESARFAMAELDGVVIAATLYLHDDTDVYSYLGGADHDHQQVRPTNAVVHDTIAWAREHGKKRLVLGGGYREGDGIFRFKSSFSPQRATLELARRVHRPDAYEDLASAWKAAGGQGDTGFFPLYRAPVSAS